MEEPPPPEESPPPEPPPVAGMVWVSVYWQILHVRLLLPAVSAVASLSVVYSPKSWAA